MATHVQKITQIIDVFENSSLTELYWTCTDPKNGSIEKIRLSKLSKSNYLKNNVQHPSEQYSITSNKPLPSDPTESAHSSSQLISESIHKLTHNRVASCTHHVIDAPMVGIFYTSPAPGVKPFVEIGQTVKKGAVLCVLEAMKVFNQIESDIDGRIVSCFIQNGEAVEFGQPLFAIDPL